MFAVVMPCHNKLENGNCSTGCKVEGPYYSCNTTHQNATYIDGTPQDAAQHHAERYDYVFKATPVNTPPIPHTLIFRTQEHLVHLGQWLLPPRHLEGLQASEHRAHSEVVASLEVLQHPCQQRRRRVERLSVSLDSVMIMWLLDEPLVLLSAVSHTVPGILLL